MGKALVIIGLVVLCLAFSVAEKKTKRNGEYSDGPESTKYSDVDVKNPRVQEAAKQVLRDVGKKRSDCPNASLIEVTKAKHKLYSENRDEGAEYELELSFNNGYGRTMECKVTVWGSLNNSPNRPKPEPYDICECTDKEKIIEEEEC